MAGLKHPVTPDGRYFVVGGKLWRMSNPELDPRRKSALAHEMMDARRAVKEAKPAGDQKAEAESTDRSKPWGAGTGLVAGWRARSEQADGEKHPLCRLVRPGGPGQGSIARSRGCYCAQTW
jgi:hypothetical protein